MEQNWWTQIMDVLQTHQDKIWNLVGAVVLLFVGWFFAFVIAHFFQAMFGKLGLEKKMTKWLGAEKVPDIGRWVGRFVYYILLLFVLIGFFKALKLEVVTKPLDTLLHEVFAYLPRLIGPVVLLFVAWLVGSIVRVLMVKGLDKLNFDERFGKQVDVTDKRKLHLTQTLGETVYWLVFLLFLPAILESLALQSLLEPVQGMIDKVLGFLPNMFLAALTLLVGWFVARIIQRIVTGVLFAIGLDHISDRVGLTAVLGKQKLSGLAGLLVYILILIPVIIAALNSLGVEAVTRPASEMLNKILGALPGIFSAAFLLIFAYIAGKIVSKLMENLLDGLGFNKFVNKLGIAPKTGRTPSEIIGYLVIVAVMLFGSIEALNLIEFTTLSGLLSDFLVVFGKVFFGLVIFGVGLYLANLVSGKIVATGQTNASLLAVTAKVAILALAGAMALGHMGLSERIIELAFGLILGAIAVGTAIAFGIGGRDTAAKIVEGWARRWKS